MAGDTVTAILSWLVVAVAVAVVMVASFAASYALGVSAAGWL